MSRTFRILRYFSLNDIFLIPISSITIFRYIFYSPPHIRLLFTAFLFWWQVFQLYGEKENVHEIWKIYQHIIQRSVEILVKLFRLEIAD